MPLNPHTLRRSPAAVAVSALMLSALLASCSRAAPPPPSPAATAGVALLAADNSYRSDFRTVVAEHATNSDGLPCGRKCWDLTHLQRDDTGTISGAYKRATAVYSGAGQTAPKELALWKDAIDAVQTDIIVWGGGGIGSNSIEAKTYADLDKADALIKAFAPASVRAGAARPTG